MIHRYEKDSEMQIDESCSERKKRNENRIRP